MTVEQEEQPRGTTLELDLGGVEVGNIVIPGFGDPAEVRRGPNVVKVGKVTDAKYSKAEDVKNLFVQMLYSGDKRLAQFVTSYADGDVNLAQKLWNKAADDAEKLAGAGKPVDFFELMKSPTFQSRAGAIAGGPQARQDQIQQIKIDKQTAAMELASMARQQGYAGKFTAKQINDFMNAYNAEAAKSKTIYRADGTVQYTAFDKNQFAKNWLWSNANFTDKTTAGNALTTLADLQKIVRENGLQTEYGQDDLYALAKQIATGKETAESVKIRLGDEAVQRYYPQLANRMKAAPGSTIMGLTSNIRNIIAQTWEMSSDEIGLDNKILQKALGPVTGEGQPMSAYDVKLAAMNSPEFEKTQKANETARDLAIGLGRAWGFGV